MSACGLCAVGLSKLAAIHSSPQRDQLALCESYTFAYEFTASASQVHFLIL